MENRLNIPVICTRGIVVFPGQDVMVEVGRRKSINAVNIGEASYDGNVFVVCQSDIMVDEPSESSIYQVGTICHIKTVRKKEGFMRVTFTGLQRARIVSMDWENDCIYSTVDVLEDVAGDPTEEIVLVKRVIAQFDKSNAITSNFPPDVLSHLSRGVAAVDLADQFAQYYAFPLEIKQKILETLSLNERLLIILSELEKEKEMSKLENVINQKVKAHIEDGQKEYYLREKLRAIKEELGDVSNVTDDSEDLRKKIMDNPYPEHVKKKALEELKKYEMLPQASGEASVSRNYLDWLLNVPWWQETVDCEDLNHVQEI